MNWKSSFTSLLIATALMTGVSGIQTRAENKKDVVSSSQHQTRHLDLVWPLPPDPPRVRWLAEYTDMARIKNPAAKKRGLMEKIAGTKSVKEKLQLVKPYGVTTDSLGRIYVADIGVGSVFVIDPRAKTVVRRDTSSRAPMALPVGLAVDSENRLFVSDAKLQSITCFSPSGEVISRFGSDSLGRPGGIAIDPQRNRLYVVDAKSSRIAAFDTRKFNLLGYFGKPSKFPNPEKGTFSGPTNVAVDPRGNIYIADTFNCRVQILSPEGKVIRVFGCQGVRPGEFIRPKGIAVDSEGHVYVADAEFNNFQVLSQEGQPLLAVGVLGTAPGEFGLIAGIHIDSSDRIYTTEMYAGRVQVFQYIKQPESGKERR